MDNAETLRKAQQNSTFIFDPKTMVDKNGVPLYFTKENATKIGGDFERRKMETFEALQKMYSKDQVSYLLTIKNKENIGCPKFDIGLYF